MAFLQHGTTEEYYQKFIELQEKLRKSEEERLKLEMKFNEMVQVSREEEQIYYRKLRAQYKHFVEEDRRRQERNEKILRILERIESRAAMLAAKTQRFELLRTQYHAYLQRILTNRKAQEEQSMPTINETKQGQFNEPIKAPKVDVVKQYITSLSTPICREEVLKAARSNELLAHPDASYEDDHYDLSKYKSNACNLADQIIHSIHSRPKFEAEATKRWGAGYCGTKLSSPKLPRRKPDDVELFDYGGSGDRFGNLDLPARYLEKYDNEKIVREDLQNEKKFFLPKGEDDRIPTVRFDVIKSSKITESHGLASEEEDEIEISKSPIGLQDGHHFGEDQGDEICFGEVEMTEKEEDNLGDGKERDKEEGEKVDGDGKDGEEVSTNHAEEIQNDDRIDGREDGSKFDANQVPYGRNEEGGGQIKVDNDLPHQSQVEEGLDRGHDDYGQKVKESVAQRDYGESHRLVQDIPIECDQPVIQYDEEGRPIQYGKSDLPVNHEERERPMVYDEQIERDDEQGQPIQYDGQGESIEYDKKGTPIQYDGHNPPIEYNEKSQPIEYGKQGQPIEYGEQGQPIEYGEQGQPIEYGEQGQPIEYGEQGQPIEYSEQGQYDEQGPPIQCDEQGQPIQYGEQDQPIPYDGQGQPIQYDAQGQPISFDGQGQPMQYGEQGQPMQYGEQGQPIQYDEQGQPIQYGEQGGPILYDGQGQPIPYDRPPIQYDEQIQPMSFDGQGQPIQYNDQNEPIQYDEQGQPIHYDEHGRPIHYDEHGQLIQYDEQGQPIQYYNEQYQYDPNSEYYQQYQENDAPNVGVSEETVEPIRKRDVVQSPSRTEDEKKIEGAKEEAAEQKPKVADMLDTDTESTRQETKASNESDFDFSNS